MKNILCLVLALCATTIVFAQNKIPVNDPPRMADPAIKASNEYKNTCDSINHIFIASADSFKSMRGPLIPGEDFGGGTGPASYNLYSMIPGGNPCYYLPEYKTFTTEYATGTDSATIFQTYSNIVANIGECLLIGPVKSLTHTYTRDVADQRELLYVYHIGTLNTGYDQRLKNWKIKIMFLPSVIHRTKTGADDYSIQIHILPETQQH